MQQSEIISSRGDVEAIHEAMSSCDGTWSLRVRSGSEEREVCLAASDVGPEAVEATGWLHLSYSGTRRKSR